MSSSVSRESAESDTLLPNLQATEIINADDPTVVSYTEKNCGDTVDPKEQAVKLYYAIRDEIRYDPYSIDLTVAGSQASHVLAIKRGWCVSKATLLAACCRVLNIPARLGFADVVNHLSTEKLRQQMGTDIFYWHGYTSIYLDDRWVKATPAFNIELCEKFRIRPLEFDGSEDSIYHPFDMDGRRHMEYVNFRGEFSDLPLDEMAADFKRYYPNFGPKDATNNFEVEVEAETASP